jgi:hypothetical protein
MKKLFAMLMALVMALSCTVALAEEAPQGVTITSELVIDRDAARNLMNQFAQDPSQAELIDAMAGIVGSLRSQLVIADGGAQLDLFLVDSLVLSCAGVLTEDGLAVASTLFPSYAITVTPDTISELLEKYASQAGVSNGELTPEIMATFQQLSEAGAGYVNEFVAACQGAITYGDPEMGEFTSEDMTFNSHVPMEIDVQAMVDAVKTLADQLANDEAVQSSLQTLQGMGLNVNTDFDTSSLEGQANVEATGDIYMNIDDQGNQVGATLVLVYVVGGEGENVSTTNVSVLVNEGEVYVGVDMPEAQTNLNISVVPDSENGIAVRLDADAQDNYFGVAFTLALGDVVSADCYIYLFDDENPLVSGNLTVQQGGARTLDVTDSSKTVVAFEDLMNDSEGEVSGGLFMDILFNGLGSVTSAATDALPEEVNTLMGAFMGGNGAEED